MHKVEQIDGALKKQINFFRRETAMSAVSIMVKWDMTTEFITFDLEKLKNGAQVDWTNENWDWDEPGSYHYKTKSEFRSNANGGGILKIRYLEEDNEHLKELGIYWGYSIFNLDKQMKSGNVEFFCTTTAGMDDGEGNKIYQSQNTWKRFSLKEEKPTQRERETIERDAREQVRFRKRLMMIDPRCAITEECERSALEAAHIVPVKGKGADIDSNGLMLRADLHHLFDSGMFDIKPDGSIELTDKLKSAEYRFLLEGKFIEGTALARISDALIRRHKTQTRANVQRAGFT